MSTKKDVVTILPFKEYQSAIDKYSTNNQTMEKEYKNIIESEMGQGIYERRNGILGPSELSQINPNVPVTNIITGKVKIEDQDVSVYKEFWQYKQAAGTIFTDWTSASLSHIQEDMAVRHLPLYGKKELTDPTLILSNTNNVRNNLQRYGKEYLTTTNMLNATAFSNGISYGSSQSPYRSGTKNELNKTMHGNFKNHETGDSIVRNEDFLRVDLPENYANVTLSSWQKANYAWIIYNTDAPELSLQEKQQFGTFNLDSMKLTGITCLTPDYGIIPNGYNTPVGVYNNNDNLPPITTESGLYCSANTNFVTMPINSLYKNLDTSIQVSPGNNSLTLGSTMSPALKEFIQTTLHNYNRDFLFMNIYKSFSNSTSPSHSKIMQNIKKIAGYLFENGQYEYFTNPHNQNNQYQNMFALQRQLISLNQGDPELEIFINHLSFLSFGGNGKDKNAMAHIICKDISPHPIPIHIKTFLILPTMLAEDLFTVPNPFTDQGSDCITPGATYSENASNCAFRGHANMWQQKPQAGMDNPTFVPNMFDDPENQNNWIYNLSNPYIGRNYYNAATTF
jgi:hypothetical protein